MPATTYETLAVDIRDGIAVVTIDRPQVRNAINAQVQPDLRAAPAAIAPDESVGAVIFTGARDKACVAGNQSAGSLNPRHRPRMPSALSRGQPQRRPAINHS